MENLELKETHINVEPVNWIPLSSEMCNKRYRSFEQDGEPVLVHIIKTGFKDVYMVVWEDAYELMLGHCQLMNKKEIKDKLDIEIDI